MEDDVNQNQEDNAIVDEVQRVADNEGGDTGDGDSQDDDDTSEVSDADTQDDTAKDNTDAVTDEDDDDDDDEDDAPPFDIFRPVESGVPPVEDFDIKGLPRDEEGKIDPAAANAAIKKYAEQYHQSKVAQDGTRNQAVEQARSSLTGQWTKAIEKFPHVAKNKELRKIASTMHLNSVREARDGRGQYISPMAAMKKVGKMYEKAIKSGIQQQKSKKYVESATRSESSGGKQPQSSQSTEYAKLKRIATTSKDPVVAGEARRKILRMRREARRAS